MMFRQLKDILDNMTEEELSCHIIVRVRSTDEHYPIVALMYTDHTDVLDKGHPHLIM